jgi:hypothetical protein
MGVFPEPALEKLSRFSAAIFKHAKPNGFVSLRAFPDAVKNGKTIFIDPISLGDPQFNAVVAERARQAAEWPIPAVFCPPCATFKTATNATTENIFEGVVLSIECDKNPGAAVTLLRKLLGEPTLIVASGGEWEDPGTGEVEQKVHIHWRLKTTAVSAREHKRLREARDLATKLVGGDSTNIPLVHPIRWPGTWHRKKNPPRLADIVSQSENEIDLDEALEILRDEVGAGAFENEPRFSSAFQREKKAADFRDVVFALAAIPNEKLEWADWNYIGLATWGATAGSDEGGRAFAEWSAKSSKNDPETTWERWKHYKTSPPSRIGMGTLAYLARKHDPNWTFIGAGPKPPPVDPVDLWGKFEPPTLPRGVLPDVIERFAFEQGRDMGADMAGIAVSALAVCAAAIPDKIKLQVKRHNKGWLESARIWVGVIGPPSTMKSPVMAAAARPLRRIDAELARQYAEEKARYDALPKEEKALNKPPKHVRVMLQDTTIEAAQEVLKDSPDGVLCYQDELSGWFGSMEKYSSAKGGARDRAFWLEAYNGGQYAVNRIGRGSTYIDPLSVSLLGGIQPEPIRKIADESTDDGLLQRILPVILKPAIEGQDEESSPVVSEYSQLISRLHHLDNPMLLSGGILNSEASLRFDKGAQVYRQQLERKHLELQACETVNRKLASHIGKYNGIFARLCIVWHCIESEPGKLTTVISEDTARRVGRFLHGFLLPHALAFYAGILGLSNDHGRLTAVAGYILAQGLDKITNRDIQRGDRSMRGLGRRDTELVFDQLDALGWISCTPSPYKGAPPHWTVNPSVHTKFTERAKAEADRRARDRKVIAAMMGKVA